ncbi:hypothetical protein B0T24DRAFT_630998 [Lasiosphaeria ovina]|uniref:Uncharacterized protein n=1 Tax=Lasiosphaeria ovina TaxID=92902 RepID=A0AAE0K3S3_9PEZI|nr:hypothetical protein B0T24DRAFT_630998 [Lasiosphaeria ovina]
MECLCCAVSLLADGCRPSSGPWEVHTAQYCDVSLVCTYLTYFSQNLPEVYATYMPNLSCPVPRPGTVRYIHTSCARDTCRFLLDGSGSPSGAPRVCLFSSVWLRFPTSFTDCPSRRLEFSCPMPLQLALAAHHGIHPIEATKQPSNQASASQPARCSASAVRVMNPHLSWGICGALLLTWRVLYLLLSYLRC